MDYQEEKVELSEEDVAEINRLLQEAANNDVEEVVESPLPIDFTGLEPDIEGWDEFVERVLAEDPPVDEEEV